MEMSFLFVWFSSLHSSGNHFRLKRVIILGENCVNLVLGRYEGFRVGGPQLNSSTGMPSEPLDGFHSARSGTWGSIDRPGPPRSLVIREDLCWMLLQYHHAYAERCESGLARCCFDSWPVGLSGITLIDNTESVAFPSCSQRKKNILPSGNHKGHTP